MPDNNGDMSQIKTIDNRTGKDIRIHILPGTMMIFHSHRIVARIQLHPGLVNALICALRDHTLPTDEETEAERRQLPVSSVTYERELK